MKYLKSFKLLNEIQEHSIMFEQEQRRIFNNYYPLNLFSVKSLNDIDFSDITIFYGNNGSGKTTLVNIIAEKMKASRKSVIDKGSFFDLYVSNCDYEMSMNIPVEIKIMTSDDIFEYILDIRSINSNVNRKKEMLSRAYLNNKYNSSGDSFYDYENIKNSYEAKKRTMSTYVRDRLENNNIIEYSNGQSALMFWEREIKEESIYILDEPENSLSPENQLKLKKFIEDSVRFFDCQFIISTHSPFLLGLNDAKIYDLDSNPVIVSNWKDLPNIRTYYNFFKERENDFK